MQLTFKKDDIKTYGWSREELAPLSAVILQDETLHQTNQEGKPIIQVNVQ